MRKIIVPVLVLFVTIGVCLPAFAVTDEELDMAARREALQAESRYGLVDDPALVARVQAIFEKVARFSAPARVPVHLRILNNPQPNAFSLPDGSVYVNVGLFRLDPTDDELAFVLGHEIAHVCREHCKQVVGAAERGGPYVTRAYMSGYTRYNETQADLDGVAAMVHAGFDPSQALHFLQKMGALERYNARADDHPMTAERLQSVSQLLQQHPDWSATAAHAPAVVAEPYVNAPRGYYSSDPYSVRPWGQ